MPAKRKATEGTGYLLEAWRPPDDAGAPLACLATTFTFDGAVFEEECLARFLDIQGSPEESGVAYLIEREEKMAVVTAAVLADAQHARGSRYLRWDLLAARLPRSGAACPILHSKVWLLVWENAVRLVVGSANLTRQGLRLNHELFGVLDYREKQHGPAKALATLLGFLRTAAGWVAVGPARQRWLDAVNIAEGKAGRWSTDRPFDEISIHALVTGPGSESLLSQLRELSPGAAPDYAEVLSPFFDPPAAENAPARELWKIMARDAEVCFWLTTDKARSSAGLVFLMAPEALVVLPPGRNRGGSEASRCLAVLEDNRPLHAKSLWLERVGRWVMYVIGSHNFTSPGIGLGAMRNSEVSLAYVAKDPGARKRLSHRVMAHEDIIGEVRWLETEIGSPEDEATAHMPPLPPEFGAAVFHCDDSGRHLVMHFMTPRGVWSVSAAEEHGGVALYDDAESRAVFDAHPELRDGTVLIVPSVRSLTWEPNYRASVHFFATAPGRIEIDRIEITSRGRPSPAVLKVEYTAQLSKVPNQKGLFEGGVAAHFKEAEGAAEVLAKSPVEMVMFYRHAGSGPWLQKRFVLKRSIKIGQTIFDILAAA